MSEEGILLARLKVHGKEFLSSFADLSTNREVDDESSHLALDVTSSTTFDDESDEWTGFASNDLDMDLDAFPKTRLDVHTPDVVVFCEGTSASRTHPATKTQGRSFMSSKVSRVKESLKATNENSESIENGDKDISNIHNDALLHRLVHTQLLSGSLSPESSLTAAQRRKALAGRVSELAGGSKLGKGEHNVRQDEKKLASKRVRDGMMAKQRKTDINSLIEAKNMGNYHPSLKRLFSASSSPRPRKRNRGLRMGVGKFSDGMLKLTAEEIGSVQNARTTHDHRSGSRRR